MCTIILEEEFISAKKTRNFSDKNVKKHYFLFFLPRRPRLESSTLITRHRIWLKIVSMKSLRVTTGAAFSNFYFNISDSHTRAKNTACFFVRRRVKANLTSSWSLKLLFIRAVNNFELFLHNFLFLLFFMQLNYFGDPIFHMSCNLLINC